MMGMANRGEWRPAFEFLSEAIARQTGIRDYIGGEKAIQGFLAAFLSVTDYCASGRLQHGLYFRCTHTSSEFAHCPARRRGSAEPLQNAPAGWLQDLLSGAIIRSVGGRQHNMGVRFSEDVVPLGDLKLNPGRVLRRVAEAGRPVLLTSRGRGVAVVQSVSQFDASEEEREFMRAVVAGLADLDAGREIALATAMERLDLS